MIHFEATISRLTAGYFVFLLAFACVAHPIRKFIESTFGAPGLSLLIWGVFGAVAVVGGVWLRNFRPRVRLLYAALAISIGILAAAQLEISVERMHVVFYGILGFLIARDQMRSPWFPLIVGACCAPVFEEGFQALLPNRIADVRDVFLGLASTLWGGVIYETLRAK